jgi:hypothetical protein
MFFPLMSLAIAALFFVLTPGVLVSLPSGKGKLVVAATHAVLFAFIFHLAHKPLMNLAQQYELFNDVPKPPCVPSGKKPVGAPCCSGSPPKGDNGMC